MLQYVARVFQMYTHTVTNAFLLEIVVLLYVATGEILARFLQTWSSEQEESLFPSLSMDMKAGLHLHDNTLQLITPRAHARSGVKQSVLSVSSVCLSVRRKKLKSRHINHLNGVKQ